MELEAQLSILENHPKPSQVPLGSVKQPSVVNLISSPPAGCVTIRKRRHSPTVKPVVRHQPVHVSNIDTRLGKSY